MKILFDHNLPHKLRFMIGRAGTHEIVTAAYMGWEQLKNGALLRTAEAAGFEVLLTGDTTLVHEQNLVGRHLAVVALSTNNWPIVRDKVPQIMDALVRATPGTFQAIDCGTFSRKRP